MRIAASPVPSTPDQNIQRSAPELEALVGKLTDENTQLRRQVAWFQRQIFGQKSERRLPEADSVQGTLGESFDAIPEALSENKKIRIEGYDRERKPKQPTDGADESTLFFDPKKVPVQVINVPNPETEGLTPDDI